MKSDKIKKKRNSKMILGFDIDDVIFKTSEALKSVLDKCEDEEITKHKLDIMRGDAINKKIGQFLNDNVIPTIKIAKPMDNVAKVIKNLRKQSNKIVLITARGDERFPGSEDITKQLLDEYEIEYDGIIYNCNDKAKACKEHNIQFFVDDSPKHCLDVKQELGIPVIGFESDINREEMSKNQIECVRSWIELLERIKTTQM